ncbi:MAG: hypothetical protein NTX50_12510, partial [Candidatus Sumerlaeota bacterium]|nr:hypothetical protein [Candidatus Sumerlaeota bacterium]
MRYKSMVILRVSQIEALIALWLAPVYAAALSVDRSPNPKESTLGEAAVTTPTDEFGLPLITFRCNQFPAQLLGNQIHEEYGILIIFKGAAASAKICIMSEDATIKDFMDRIAANYDWVWVKTSERSYEMMDCAYAEKNLGSLIQGKVLAPQYLPVEQLNEVIEGMLNPRIHEVSLPDIKARKITVRALPQTLESVVRVLEEIDKPVQIPNDLDQSLTQSLTQALHTDEFGMPLITFRANQLPVVMVAAQFADQYGINIVFKGKAAGQKVSVIVEDTPIQDLFDLLVAGRDWIWRRTGERSFEIMDRDSMEVFPASGIKEKIIVLERMPAALAAAAISKMLNKKLGEFVTPSVRSNKIYVRAFSWNLSSIEKRLHEFIKPPEMVQSSDSPTSATDEFGLPLITFRCNQLPTMMVTAQIKDQYDIMILFKGKSAGQKITLMVEDTPLLDVLNQIVSGQDWVWIRQSERSFDIMDRATFESVVLPTWIRDKTFEVKNLPASQVAKAIEGMLNKNIGESVTADDRAKKVYLHALPQTLDLIVPRGCPGSRDKEYITRIFTIRYADPAAISKKISPLASKTGTVDVDAAKRRIIVRDQPVNIRVMERRIDIWDPNHSSSYMWRRMVGRSAPPDGPARHCCSAAYRARGAVRRSGA